MYFCLLDSKRQNDASQNKPDVRVVRCDPPGSSCTVSVSALFLNYFSKTWFRWSFGDIVCTLLLPELSVLPQLWFRCRMLVCTPARLQRYRTVTSNVSYTSVVLQSPPVVKGCFGVYIVLVCWLTYRWHPLPSCRKWGKVHRSQDSLKRSQLRHDGRRCGFRTRRLKQLKTPPCWSASAHYCLIT